MERNEGTHPVGVRARPRTRGRASCGIGDRPDFPRSIFREPPKDWANPEYAVWPARCQAAGRLKVPNSGVRYHY